jgi:peptide-methionine (S)-S-oxide reductase
VQAAFDQLPGVTGTTVGYSGGSYPNPTYEDVCSHKTGHAEVVEVEFDPEKISYEQLLDVFWKIHDPTTLNRQGPDVGDNYRSAIYFHGPDQEATALASRERAQQRFSRPIVTEIAAASDFWRAEDYHQRYYEAHGIACHIPSL